MGMSRKFSSFICEIKIIQAQNIEPIKPNGNLFTRLYLPTGNNKRIQLTTKKVVPSKKNLIPFWDESFNLECSCPQEFLETLKQESLCLELRQSKKLLLGSNLVGKGEVPWKEVFESPNMKLKLWVKMDLECKEGLLGAPELLVEIKLQVSNKGANNRSLNCNKWDECGCKHGHDHDAWCSSEDYDLFALVAALEAF